MPDVSSKPHVHDSHALPQWNNALVGPLSRLLALGHPHLIGWGAIGNAIEREVWMPTREDLSENALLALLLNQSLHWQDPLGNAYHNGIVAPMNEEMEALCMGLAARGCSPRLAPEGLGGATSLDLALMHNAPRFIKAHADPRWYQGRTIDGLPWLHAAARGGCIEVLQVLLEQGVDPNLRDATGATALFHASHPNTVKLLRERGCDPAILNVDNLDALSYWKTSRPGTASRVEELRAGLGRVKVATGSAAIQQFLLMAQSNTPPQLAKERRRLKITGSEWHEGQNIPSAYLACIHKELQSISSSRPTARRIEQITQWHEAMAQATPSQVAELAACAAVDGMDDTAHSLFQVIPSENRDAVVRDAWLGLIEKIDIRQARSHRIAQHIFKSDLSLASRAAILVAAIETNPSYPPTELLESFADFGAAASDPCWLVPGFTSLALRLGICSLTITSNYNGSMSSAVDRAQLRLRERLMQWAEEGVSFADALASLPPPSKKEHLAFIEQLHAISQSVQLASASPPGSAPSRSLRL